jgi:hypothetical protein
LVKSEAEAAPSPRSSHARSLVLPSAPSSVAETEASASASSAGALLSRRAHPPARAPQRGLPLVKTEPGEDLRGEIVPMVGRHLDQKIMILQQSQESSATVNRAKVDMVHVETKLKEVGMSGELAQARVKLRCEVLAQLVQIDSAERSRIFEAAKLAFKDETLPKAVHDAASEVLIDYFKHTRSESFYDGMIKRLIDTEMRDE